MEEINAVPKKLLVQSLKRAAEEVYRRFSYCPVLAYQHMYQVDEKHRNSCINLDEKEYEEKCVRCWQLHWVGDLIPDCVKSKKDKGV